MKILVTGGAGYIGSHTCLSLLEAGHEVVILDDLSNSKAAVVDRIRELSGRDVTFYKGDIADSPLVSSILKDERPGACIHFAGYKAVGESVGIPLSYYQNNVSGTVSLLKCLDSAGVKNIIFSSSATVYGEPDKIPVSEDSPRGICTNPYGWTKWMIEQILTDLQISDPSWNVVILRYFNPIGAHESGRIGEEPNGIPNNLMPYIARVAIGLLPVLGVFGDDYDTVDGTGVRDYIHVGDLAKGHALAIKCFDGSGGLHIYNLGTGRGYSVLEVVAAFEAASGCKVPYEIRPRRPGDIAKLYADPSKAQRELGFVAEHDLYRMCEDSYRFQRMNPNGIE